MEGTLRGKEEGHFRLRKGRTLRNGDRWVTYLKNFQCQVLRGGCAHEERKGCRSNRCKYIQEETEIRVFGPGREEDFEDKKRGMTRKGGDCKAGRGDSKAIGVVGCLGVRSGICQGGGEPAIGVCRVFRKEGRFSSGRGNCC